MLVIVQSNITREKLRKGRYVPDKLTLLNESPMDSDARKRHYRPAVELLSKINDFEGGFEHGQNETGVKKKGAYLIISRALLRFAVEGL